MRAIPEYIHDQIGYYVYLLVDPRDKQVFYVGKGRGNRLFQHVNEALTNEDRSTLKLDRIREIKSVGLEVGLVVHRHGLTEKEAYEVEAALIDAYGTSRDALSELTNVASGHHDYRGAMSVDDLIAQHAAEEAAFDVSVLILKLSRQYERQMTSHELYERTRGIWNINPLKHRHVNTAMPVTAGGVIREVYRILRWVEVDTWAFEESLLRRKRDDAPSKTRYRWMFEGEVDQPMRERYFGRRVPDIAVQSPTLWRGPAVSSGKDPEIIRLSRP